MKQILLTICLLITFNISGQEKEKGKKTRAENKKKAQEEKIEAWNKLSKAEQDSIKINREIRIQNAFDEMMKKMSEINY